jgi:glycosyltransferase involved in cell wall biosynthesis
LVDGGSTDRTLDIARTFPVKILYENPPGSPANARNLGAFQATGDYILFVDADTKLDKDCLLQSLHYLEDPRIVGLSLNYIFDPKTSFEKKLARWRTARATVFKSYRHFPTLIKKKVFDIIRFDDTLGYGEDADFSKRLANYSKSNGLKIMKAENCLVYARLPECFLEFRKQAKWYGETISDYIKKNHQIEDILRFIDFVAFLFFPFILIYDFIGWLMLNDRHISDLFDFLMLNIVRGIFFCEGFIHRCLNSK